MASTQTMVTTDGRITDENLAEVRALVAKANKGSRAALDKLRETFGRDAALWGAAGTAASQTEDALLLLMYGDVALYTEEATRRNLAKMRTDILGPNPSALERLLAARITATYLAVNYAEASYAQQAKAGKLDIAWADYFHRRITRAQRRHLDAIVALAKVRRLQLPSIQLNIGEKQVNIASPGGA